MPINKKTGREQVPGPRQNRPNQSPLANCLVVDVLCTTDDERIRINVRSLILSCAVSRLSLRLSGGRGRRSYRAAVAAAASTDGCGATGVAYANAAASATRAEPIEQTGQTAATCTRIAASVCSLVASAIVSDSTVIASAAVTNQTAAVAAAATAD